MNTNFDDRRKSRKCCKGTGMEFCLAVTLLIVVTTVLLSGYLFTLSMPPIVAEMSACLTPQCIKLSAQMLDFMDNSVDPCEDFHEFSCGNIIKTAYDRRIQTTLKSEFTGINNQLDTMIIAPPSEDDAAPIVMQKKFFHSCIDLQEIDIDKDRMFFSLMQKAVQWPILESYAWREKHFSWTNTMILCQRFGLPFDWFLHIDVFKSDKNYLRISPPKSCDFLKGRNQEDYITMMADIIVNISGHRANTISEITEVLNFQKKLSLICKRGIHNSPIIRKLRDLEETWPEIDWTDFLTVLSGGVKKWHKNSQLVYDIDHYIVELDDLLQKTPKKVQANYIAWKILEYFAPYLSKPIREVYNNYIEKNTDEEIERFDFCLAETKARFQFVSETELARKTINSEDAITEIFISVRDQFIARIENIEWIEENDKLIYIDFLNRSRLIVGAKKEVFEDGFYDQYLHIGQPFTSDNIVKMISERAQSYYYFMFRFIGEDAAPGLITTNELVFDTYKFYDEEQEIILPASLLQQYIYDAERPQYLNYATLGTLLGSFLTNIFEIMDTESANVTETTISAVAEKIRCLSGRKWLNYNHINLGDIIGREVAYGAYQKWVEQNAEEASLPALDYTPNQLFWIMSSLVETSKQKNLLTLKHLATFSEDFACEEGSKMNPKNKCDLF